MRLRAARRACRCRRRPRPPRSPPAPGGRGSHPSASASGTSCTRMCCAAGLVEGAQIGVEVVAVALRPPPGVDPGDVLVGAQRQALRQHRDAARADGGGVGLRIDLAGGHDGHGRGRARSGSGRCPARAARRAAAPMNSSPTRALICAALTAARTQQPHALALEGDDGRLEPELTLAAVEQHPHRLAELLAHVLGPGRRQPPEAVGRRRGDAAAEGGQQLLCHRVGRHADGDGVLAAGDDVVHVAGARQHHGQRPGPERLGQPRGDLRHLAHPAMQEARAVEVHDHRVTRRAALDLEDLGHRGRVLRVGAEAVHGLGGKRDQLAVAQCLHGGVDFDLGGSDGANHR